MTELKDYQWLVDEEGQSWLRRLANTTRSLTTVSKALRRDLGAAKARLVIDQIELRKRARVKFSSADKMFFTNKGLQQSTDEWIATYKATRFPAANRTADLCCGIGGDLLQLCRRHRTIGVEQDPIVALLASANCRAFGAAAEISINDAMQIDVLDFAAWHIDPDRRAHHLRTSQIEYSQPTSEQIQGLIKRNPSAAIKLAPGAAVLSPCWLDAAELEWIGHHRQCQQLIAWFGGLSKSPGKRRATVLTEGEVESETFVGDAQASLHITDRVGRYLFEPHPAVLAAGLAAELAARHSLCAITPGGGYLTGDRVVLKRLLSAFEVLDVAPFRLQNLRKIIQDRDIGQVEIKKRSVHLDPNVLGQQLRGRGQHAATLIITRIGKRKIAILVRRTDTTT